MNLVWFRISLFQQRQYWLPCYSALELTLSSSRTYINPSGPTSDLEPCGPRCSRIYIFQPVDKAWNPPAETGSFFNCTITISQVQNASHLQPFHSMSDQTAIVAAGAIGVGGNTNDNPYPSGRYRNRSTWGQRLGNSTNLAELLVGKYTVGVIAAYDMYGPSIEVMGLRSTFRARILVDWSYIVRSPSPGARTLLVFWPVCVDDADLVFG